MLETNDNGFVPDQGCMWDVQRFSSSNDAGVAELMCHSVAEDQHTEAEHLC